MHSDQQQQQQQQHFKVDIVASRDLVRGFQRRLRGIVPMPADKLAVDAIDVLYPSGDVASDGNLAAAVAEEELQQAAKEREQRQRHQRAKTPSAYERLRRPKSATSNANQPMSLHDSLVAALSSSGDDAASSTLASSSSSTSASFSRDGNGKEAASRRLRAAYRGHKEELKTKWHPGTDVKKAQRETLPNILERDCNSQLRHASSTRCYYFDHRICESDGRRRQVAQQQQQQPQQKQSADDNERDDAERKLGFSSPVPATIRIQRKKPVPVEERPEWTFISPTDEAASDRLRRRLSTPQPVARGSCSSSSYNNMVSVPTPYEERRMHVSPVVTQRFVQLAYEIDDDDGGGGAVG